MKVTPEQIESYIDAADSELGHECTEAWVDECRKILRESMQGGAAHYQKLRDAHWSDGKDTLVVVRAGDLRLGTQTYTGDLLDEALSERK